MAVTDEQLKVGIIGVGHVGAALAFALLFNKKIKEIWINDRNENRLLGEYEDLLDADAILGSGVRIEIKDISDIKDCNKIFICAGEAREKSTDSYEELFKRNLDAVKKIVDVLPGERCYIITNPADKLGKELGIKYLGDTLDKTRIGIKGHDGGWILDKKGYTNWGIVAEALKVL